MKTRTLFSCLSPGEVCLWGGSAFSILVAFFLFDGQSGLTLAASLIGVTSLIFSAKGHPVGPLLMIFFCLLYGAISFGFAYYGEMLTYLGMSLPMAVFSWVSWLKNPFREGSPQVKVDRLGRKDGVFLAASTAAVTALFYFVLAALHTAYLLPSTLSVATSFLAAALTYKRSPLFAAAYAANDLVLILLWGLAAATDRTYLSVMICFVAFFVNDLYGFLSWKRMERRQAECLS